MNWIQRFKYDRNNLLYRKEFVSDFAQRLTESESLLDAGCGSQQFRGFFSHCDYYSQDFMQVASDEKNSFTGYKDAYEYPYKIDFVGNVWEIDTPDESFDNILCTEVFEHIAYPIETAIEFARILKKGGLLCLTVPSNSLRHMDPHYYYSGFSDRWLQKILTEEGFEILVLETVGDYYSWLKVEIYRLFRSENILGKIGLIPALINLSIRKATKESINSLCMGYQVIAKKK
jgi:SAM-dependent methyltransferase